MITIKAIKLARDKIIYYTLKYPNGDIKDMPVRQLGMAMWMGEIEVINLKLTKDDKIIHKNRNGLTHEIKERKTNSDIKLWILFLRTAVKEELKY